MSTHKIEEILKNTKFANKVLKAKTKEEVKKLFADQNILISQDELQVLFNSICKISEISSQLSEKELESIFGGRIIFMPVDNCDNFTSALLVAVTHFTELMRKLISRSKRPRSQLIESNSKKTTEIDNNDYE